MHWHFIFTENTVVIIVFWWRKRGFRWVQATVKGRNFLSFSGQFFPRNLPWRKPIRPLPSHFPSPTKVLTSTMTRRCSISSGNLVWGHGRRELQDFAWVFLPLFHWIPPVTKSKCKVYFILWEMWFFCLKSRLWIKWNKVTFIFWKLFNGLFNFF